MSERISDGSRLRPERIASHRMDGPRVVARRRKFGPIRTLFARIMRVNPYFETRLDTLGSEVWLMLDGRSLDEVLAQLQANHPDETDLAARLGQCISTLASRRLIRL